MRRNPKKLTYWQEKEANREVGRALQLQYDATERALNPRPMRFTNEEVQMPDAEYVREMVGKGYRYLMVSHAPDGHRGWLFGRIQADLQRVAGEGGHTNVVIYWVASAVEGGR